MFFAGVVSTTTVFATILIFQKRKEWKTRMQEKVWKRVKSIRSLSRTLDLAVEMSGSCRGAERPMVAIAVGQELLLDFVEPKLMKYLGYSNSDIPPRTIYDLLPPCMAPHHRLWVAKAIKANCLPERLQHPLRCVEIRHASGFYIHMDLNIEWAADCTQPTFDLVFAPCASPPASLSGSKEVRFGEQAEHENAVVMLLDIVEFTKACSQLSAREVSRYSMTSMQLIIKVN